MTKEQIHVAMAQLNLVFQIVILALVIIGIVLKRRGNMVWHGNVMLSAVLLNLLSFLSVMGPSFLKFGVDYLAQPSDVTSIIGIMHGSLGAIATALGLWLTASWAFFNPSNQFCSRSRRTMLAITCIWIASSVSGIIVFGFHTVLYPD